MFTGLIAYLALVAASAGAPASAKDVDAVLTKYRKAEAFRAKVKKTVAQEVLGTENSGNGQFFFSKGKLRLEMSEPENTILVYDGKTIWMETRLDSKTVEVTKVKSKELKKNDSLLAAIFERGDMLRTFKITKTRDIDGMKVFTFVPKDKKKTEVRELEIGLSGKELGRIAYLDDRENRVTFDFTDLIRETISGEKFAYTPPKGASVTEL